MLLSIIRYSLRAAPFQPVHDMKQLFNSFFHYPRSHLQFQLIGANPSANQNLEEIESDSDSDKTPSLYDAIFFAAPKSKI
jgi:hypothetical protein